MDVDIRSLRSEKVWKVQKAICKLQGKTIIFLAPGGGHVFLASLWLGERL